MTDNTELIYTTPRAEVVLIEAENSVLVKTSGEDVGTKDEPW